MAAGTIRVDLSDQRALLTYIEGATRAWPPARLALLLADLRALLAAGLALDVHDPEPDGPALRLAVTLRPEVFDVLDRHGLRLRSPLDGAP